MLDCPDEPQAPDRKGTLIAFRTLLIAQDIDRRLIEQPVAIAEQSQDLGRRHLRAALDSSPLWGAARVEDTYSLVGHALKKALPAAFDTVAEWASSPRTFPRAHWPLAR